MGLSFVLASALTLGVMAGCRSEDRGTNGGNRAVQESSAPVSVEEATPAAALDLASAPAPAPDAAPDGALDSGLDSGLDAALDLGPDLGLISRRMEFGAMGTKVILEAQGDDAEALDAALAASRVELDRVEDMMTSWRDSPLVRMNDGADGTPQKVPQELAELTARALTVARLSGGAFDPTYASVGKLWDFKADPPVLPNAEEITAALGKVGWAKVQVDRERSEVTMPGGTRLGLGGIAKGYGVDRAMQVLIDHGVENALVNAGGDLKALGTDMGKPWTIAIKHPRDRERAIAVVPVSNVCLVTSGDYERFFELDGERYHHIIDPRTGRPAKGCMSATVTAPDAAVADAVATAVCVLGPEVGLQFVERLPKIEAIVVDLDGRVQRSSGLEQAR